MTAFEEQVAASGAVVALFAGAVAVLLAAAPPTQAQLAAADPLVQLAASGLGLWAIVPLSLLAPICWVAVRPPSAAAWRRAARLAAAGGLAVALGMPLLRAVVGPAFPPFIPPEESARPGLALGLGAALLEEGVFRLGLLAPLDAVASQRMASRRAAAVLSVAVCAAALALSHELGPGALVFHAPYLLSRFLVLGCAMGALFIRPGPSFLVAGHCAAHVAIPFLFPGGTT